MELLCQNCGIECRAIAQEGIVENRWRAQGNDKVERLKHPHACKSCLLGKLLMKLLQPLPESGQILPSGLGKPVARNLDSPKATRSPGANTNDIFLTRLFNKAHE